MTSKSLAEADVHFEMIAFNPVSSNPAVEAEMFVNLLQVLRESPNFDQRAIDEYMVETQNLPQKILKSVEQVGAEQKVEAQMVAEQQVSMEEQQAMAATDPMLPTEGQLPQANALKQSDAFGPAELEQQPPPQMS